jgi:DNA-binding MarR family transcriptional regulator
MDILDMAGHLIRRLHQQSIFVFAKRTQAAGFDLTPVQYAALEAIHTHPGRDQAFVAEIIGYDRPTIGAVINRLEKKGWVRRVIKEQDRRSRELSLTESGNNVRLAVKPLVKDLQKQILDPLNDSEQALLINLARKIVLPPNAS